MKNLLANFNKPDTVLVITSYPNPANGKYGKRDSNAVAWHSERLLAQLSRERRVLVCAEDIGTKSTFSPNENILVKRIWEKGNVFSLIKLAKFILAQDQIKSVFVQFEFNVLGGTLLNIAFIALLYFLRLRGKKITFELHQVLTDIGKLARHINITNPLMQFVYNMGLRVFYTALGIVAHEIIVFEEELKIRLKSFVPTRKINVLCLSVNRAKTISRHAARKILGLSQKEFIVFQFGYINGYKGIDWILSALSGVKKSGLRLLIAGGQNPYLKDRPYYQKFYNSIVRETKKHAHVTYTDFVPDSQVYLYFSAADLAVLPYTACMSASGPFSHALSHRKPVIISEKLGDYAKSADFSQALGTAHLKKDDIVFALKRDDLLRTLKKAQKNASYYKRLTLFSKTLANLRDIDNVTRTLDTILFKNITAQQAARYAGKAVFKPI